jgi:hypothetical protein
METNLRRVRISCHINNWKAFKKKSILTREFCQEMKNAETGAGL